MNSGTATRAVLEFGASVPGGPMATAELRALAKVAGEKPTIVLWFADFTTAVSARQLRAVRKSGALPVVTWEPWRWPGVSIADKAAFPLHEIAAGHHDRYLQIWAERMAACRGPVGLRFAHEFNGDWYPWTVAGGASPDVFVACWRHIHNIFAAARADNVRWIWSPNVTTHTDCPLSAWYPGDDFVDILGIDGYNWGTTTPVSRWIDPGDLYGHALAQLREISCFKPILVAEVGCAEAGGDKSRWIREFLEYLECQDDVMGFVWFEHNKETDWRLVSSPDAAATIAEALRARRAGEGDCHS